MIRTGAKRCRARREMAKAGKDNEGARYNVISMRVSDDEKATLNALTHQSRKSISRLMREAIELYARQAQNLSGAKVEQLRVKRSGEQEPETVAMVREM